MTTSEESIKPDETTSRTRIVDEARSWVGTPYHHEARVKGHGVDCAQFVAAVFEQTGLIKEITTEHYPPDWHFHQAAERLLDKIKQYAGEIALEDVRPGDIVAFHFGKTYAHAGVVVEWPLLIHANMRGGIVEFIDADRDPHLRKCDKQFFSFWKEQA
jgi:cell wall-associated NlpC family hydrolase